MLEPGASSTSAETVPSTRSYYAKPPISKQEKGKDNRPPRMQFHSPTLHLRLISSTTNQAGHETIASDADVKASPRRKSTSFLFPLKSRSWITLLPMIWNGRTICRTLSLPKQTRRVNQRISMTQVGEFYDAWDELSTDSGMQSSVNNAESEQREIRLSLLMEIEKRKQTEKALQQLQKHWQRLREQLAQVGVFIPVARFVSNSLTRGMAKAEVENFEITQLSNRVHHYQAVNREMSQRNQKAISTIKLGSATLAWSYILASRPSSSEASQSLKDD
ncbi:hypothetical protein Bca4012_026148 [Brassica carinata]|uniref:Uncharacterized protein n=1 Tax=Brassica carinata TaxID=52824 RepID=A0A8X8AST4_BRACI|nr:hypothetical protein Bca52824_023252 [Brassica carinata]